MRFQGIEAAAERRAAVVGRDARPRPDRSGVREPRARRIRRRTDLPTRSCSDRFTTSTVGMDPMPLSMLAVRVATRLVSVPSLVGSGSGKHLLVTSSEVGPVRPGFSDGTTASSDSCPSDGPRTFRDAPLSASHATVRNVRETLRNHDEPPGRENIR